MLRTLFRRLHLPLGSIGLVGCLLALVSCVGSSGGAWAPQSTSDAEDEETQAQAERTSGLLNFESPHANPIALHPNGEHVYVVNTPSGTLDVLDASSLEIIDRVAVGVEPVSVAIRPDGKEVWVSNHVSDSISVIDSDPDKPTYHQVLTTIQSFNGRTRATRFDEPVAIVFAGNRKAYVALSSTNEIAVVNVASRRILRRLTVTAQDPRAMTYSKGRLYVIPFESNNQTAVSGCLPENLDVDPLCTFDADAHVVNAPDGNAQSLSLNYVLDIVRHPSVPDRDLYVFDTRTDQLLQVVDTLGTLLYGIAVDSQGTVFVTQAEARNDANGKSGTEKHGLRELENRAFLNQITKVDCTHSRCGSVEFIDLEPLPPQNPVREEALATPFGIKISRDDQVIVATAAASNKVFTMDPETGEVLDRLVVGDIPRGITLASNEDGELERVWVFNALANSVSLVDASDPTELALIDTVELEDPTEPDLKLGRIAFNSANSSSTGTFACASCHPDGHTDQLLWVLDTPLCDVGCDQIQPRLVQDVRGLRGTAPYHWDGIPGDPFGGINTGSIETYVEPNCALEDEESCTLQLIDGSLETTMCDQDDCTTNDEEKPGHLTAEERLAMAKYLLSVPYPPSVERPYDNTFTTLGMQGVRDFHFVDQCGNCHLLPHWTTTNMGGSGMDLPTWRGASDRWKNAPQNRFFFADRVKGDTRGFPERFSFTQNPKMYQMILEGSIGVPGSFARQITLNRGTATQAQTLDMLNALEQADQEGAIVLEGEGVLMIDEDNTERVSVSFDEESYFDPKNESFFYSREELLGLTESGDLLLTLTAKLGPGTDYAHPQPTLWPTGYPIRPIFPGDRPQNFPELHEPKTMRIQGDYIFEGAQLFVNGRLVDGTIHCESGELPKCDDQVVLIDLADLPTEGGLLIEDDDKINVVADGAVLHLLQVQNPQGLFSNDFPFFVVDAPTPSRARNLISSGGTFDEQGQWRANTSAGAVSWNGEAAFDIHHVTERQAWRVSLDHDVRMVKNTTYSICYTAQSDANRYIEVNIDTGPGGDRPYRRLIGTGIDPEVGGGVQPIGAALGTEYQHYHHRFVADESDAVARLVFNLAQSDISVRIDDVGVYYGKSCGQP